jgi:L-lactate dehydrogenase (cytochrome)
MDALYRRFDRSRLERIRNYDDARSAAQKILPRLLFDYIDSGAEDELTLARNVSDFQRIQLRPRIGVWVPKPDLSTTVLGSAVDLPVLTAPCGAMRLTHPDGDIGVAQGAAAAGTVHIAPSASGFTMEEIRDAAPASWFQLYRFFRRDAMEHLVGRARDAGFPVIVITVDTQVAGNREKDYRNGFDVRMRVNAKNAARLAPQLAARPAWAFRYWRDGMPFELANVRQLSPDGGPIPLSEMSRAGAESHSPSWDEIAWVRDNWPGKLVVKGILTAADARRAVGLGADGVVVSNHGGRQLDGVSSSIAALPEVVDEIGKEASILLDSGIRRGADVVKALALGADAVLVGRLATWGLATGGTAGVTHMLNILQRDIARNLQLMGCSSVRDLDASWIVGDSVRTSRTPGALTNGVMGSDGPRVAMSTRRR